uniref:RB1-inducible coiled-coil protein 1 n=1 Tax=Cyprinus carpio TaxID=7962 RepID=A0A8C2HFZ1_CYPCA
MKLYVFQVNNGSTLTFDTELAVQTVLDLKHAIQAKYKIAVQHQVLVVNGGECMVAERRVCSYSAGTDTNPIFLFNKEMILSDRAPTIPKTTFSIENEMELKVEESLMMPAVFHTVASRTQLAVVQANFCSDLMTNLLSCTFESINTNTLKILLIPLLESLTRQSYRESLEKSSSPHPRTTDEDENEDEEVGETSTQSAISHKNRKSPSPVCASGEASSQASFSPQDRLKSSCSLKAALEEEEESPERGAAPSFNVTLLDWINVQDRPNDVESVVRKCFDSINRLDPRIIQPFLTECRETITKLDNQNMKAIKGLEDRLYALDQMIASCKRLVNEQQELAQGFLANQKRAENLKDTSVLPDLCLSHLANNLQVRLKWCCYVMLHADQDGEKLQALLRLLTELLERVRVVEALSTVPQMYCLAVVEVVRRKMFIGHYRQWANALVKDGKNLYEAEKVKRECFGKLFRKSFLRNRLFRGLDSWPPSSFCTRKPRKFDFELPDISLSDLQYLKSCCPSEVQPYLRVPTLCDFEPLNQHVEVLHQLVQAAQSVDEMSQTITDLLNEQKFYCSQSAQRSTAFTPRSESTTEIISTSTKTLSNLSLKAPDCQALALPGNLEDLSPDSIDAQTFDFETIGHPNMDPVLQQGSLDLDSLAESPESDFMSAVNEFVIEQNLMSPNPISDPTSPDMMVESLYSSVINAIDSKRIQDTTTLEKENSKIAVLKLSADRYRSAAEESQNNLRKVKEDLYHFRGLVLKEQRDFGFSLKTMTIEVRNALNSVRYCHEEELRETQQTDLQNLVDSYSAEIKEREGRLKDLEARITELADARCKLEVEMALKETEMDEMRLQYEEAKSTQEEVLRAELTTQTVTLQTQIDMLNQQVQQKNEDYEVGLAELRALMRLEKDHCISELVDRHEEENTLLRQESAALKQKSQDAEKDCEERVQKIQRDHQDQFDALQREKEDEQRAFQEKEQELKNVIGDLQTENSLLSGRLERERVEALQRAEKEKEEAVKAALQEALRDFQLQKEETETRLLGQIELLENQVGPAVEKTETAMETSAAFSLESGQWTEERASLLAQLELLERTKNEEMQNLKTSLIAEQQTNFNTVLTREKLKKEQIISDLTEKLKNLTQQQEKDKVVSAISLIETLSEDRASILQEKKQMEEELNRLRSTVLVSSSFFPPNPIPVVTEAHGACGPAHVEVLSPSTPDPERLASVAVVNMTRIIQQFVLQMSQSMSSVSSRHSEKIAIRDFQVGDLVLIILDERHDNYVLFTVGPTLYFLHSESLTALDLKPATGATRRPWVLGKVMEKEYCQAKKAQNRFKVPLGTKFYRVKAVPWNKKV